MITGATTHQATLCPFLGHFCTWKWKRERNMCLYASICVRVYCSRHFYEPAGCRGPKPQALPSPLLCNSCPKAIIRGACQTGPLLWHIDTEWLAHAHSHTDMPLHTIFKRWPTSVPKILSSISSWFCFKIAREYGDVSLLFWSGLHCEILFDIIYISTFAFSCFFFLRTDKLCNWFYNNLWRALWLQTGKESEFSHKKCDSYCGIVLHDILLLKMYHDTPL